MQKTKSWLKDGWYSYPQLSRSLRELLKPYRLPAEKAQGLPD
jgi:hypothetical protein